MELNAKREKISCEFRKTSGHRATRIFIEGF